MYTLTIKLYYKMKITRNIKNLNFSLSNCSYSEGKEIVKKMTYVCAMGRNNNAVGLAHNQIGGKSRVYIAKINNKFRGFINPIIIKHSKNTHTATESCMSFPNRYSKIDRYNWVIIKHQVGENEFVEEKFNECGQAVNQHEIDHLNGLNCHKIGEL